MSWEMNSIDAHLVAAHPATGASVPVLRSSEEVGSSSTTRFGRVTIARAIPTSCCVPGQLSETGRDTVPRPTRPCLTPGSAALCCHGGGSQADDRSYAHARVERLERRKTTRSRLQPAQLICLATSWVGRRMNPDVNAVVRYQPAAVDLPEPLADRAKVAGIHCEGNIVDRVHRPGATEEPGRHRSGSDPPREHRLMPFVIRGRWIVTSFAATTSPARITDVHRLRHHSVMGDEQHRPILLANRPSISSNTCRWTVSQRGGRLIGYEQRGRDITRAMTTRWAIPGHRKCRSTPPAPPPRPS